VGRYEVDPDSIIEGSGEVVLDVAHEHARLANPGVADYQDLQQLRVTSSPEEYLSVLLYCIDIIIYTRPTPASIHTPTHLIGYFWHWDKLVASMRGK